MNVRNPRQEFATRVADLQESFPNNCSLYSFIKETVQELNEKQVTLDAMFKLFDEHGFGLIFTDKHGRYGFVLPDASVSGAFRYQLFDEKGFFCHSTFETAEEALLELCDNGYSKRAPDDTLDRLSQTREWKFSTEAWALRHAVELGKYTWQEAQRIYADLELKYDPDLWVA